MKKIGIKLIPYEEMKKNMDLIFDELKKGSIVIIDAKISPEEESKIITKTMENVDLKFKGIEISTVDIGVDRNDSSGGKFTTLIEKLRKALTGRERGITIIGSANLVKKIEKTPEELFLYM